MVIGEAWWVIRVPTMAITVLVNALHSVAFKLTTKAIELQTYNYDNHVGSLHHIWHCMSSLDIVPVSWLHRWYMMSSRHKAAWVAITICYSWFALLATGTLNIILYSSKHGSRTFLIAVCLHAHYFIQLLSLHVSNFIMILLYTCINFNCLEQCLMICWYKPRPSRTVCNQFDWKWVLWWLSWCYA